MPFAFIPNVSARVRRIGVHALFWLAVAGFFAAYFGREAESYRQSALFVSLLLPVAMATTYTLAGWLVPRYLLTGRTLRFALYVGYVLIASVWLELLVLVGSFMFGADYDIAAMNPATLDVLGLVVALYVVVLLGVAADLARRWHRLEAARQEALRAQEAAERARLEVDLRLRRAELDRLRGQLRPHVLFNALNTIYGLVLEGAPEAPEATLRLADVLDYTLYRTDAPTVPLRAELDHLRAYLDLERLRCGDRVAITFEVDPALEADSDRVAIPPLLLVPLVENAFKHGAARVAGSAWVRMEAQCSEGGAFAFTCTNSVPAGRAPHAASAAPTDANGSASGGLGLAAVAERLRLIAPDAHDLTAERREQPASHFYAHLRIPLTEAVAPRDSAGEAA